MKHLPFLQALLFLPVIVSCSDNVIDSDILSQLKEPSIEVNRPSEFIVIFGDLQTHSRYTMSKYLAAPVNWLKWQNESIGNIKAVLQTGDLTEHNRHSEWEFCRKQFSVLEGNMPVITCTGNHDYTWGENSVIESHSSTYFSEYMSQVLPDSIIVERYEDGLIDNIVVELKIYDKPLYVMALEFAPRPEVTEWADSLVTATPERKYLLMTHEFIYHWERVSDAKSYAHRQFPNNRGCGPETVWNKLVYPHDNVLAVLCGHNGYSEQVFSTNQAGREVPQVMFNLQYQANENLAHVMLWEFVNNSDTVNVSVYNPLTGISDTREGTSFTMHLPL